MTPTPDQIRSEPAGEQMDAWVAEYVMGWEWFRMGHHYEQPKGYVWERHLRWPEGGGYRECEPANGNEPTNLAHGHTPSPYSTSIAHAWEVFGETRKTDHASGIQLADVGGYEEEQWECKLFGDGRSFVGNGSFMHPDIGELVCGPCTAPLAICRAALLAVIGAHP